MRFGYCANLNFLLREDEVSRRVFDAVLEAGYDYLETQLSALLWLSDAQREALLARLDQAGLPMRANFLLFPHELPLVGEAQDLAAIAKHADTVLALARAHGSEVAVFGNGGSRRVREGMDRQVVTGQIFAILEAVAPIAEKHGVIVALEPLCSKETNMVNSFAEGAALTRRLGSPWVKNVCDWYHVATDGQSMRELIDNADQLAHLHIANPVGRIPPSPADDPALYREFVEAVKAIGYQDKVSIEAGLPQGADIAACVAEGLAALKQLFA